MTGTIAADSWISLDLSILPSTRRGASAWSISLILLSVIDLDQLRYAWPMSPGKPFMIRRAEGQHVGAVRTEHLSEAQLAVKNGALELPYDPVLAMTRTCLDQGNCCSMISSA